MYANVMVQRLRRVKSVEATSPPQAVVSYPTTQASIAGTSEVTSTHAPRRLRRSSPDPRNAPKPERIKSTKASTSSAVPSTMSSCPYCRSTLLDSSTTARGRKEGPGTTRSRALASIGRRWPKRLPRRVTRPARSGMVAQSSRTPQTPTACHGGDQAGTSMPEPACGEVLFSPRPVPRPPVIELVAGSSGLLNASATLAMRTTPAKLRPRVRVTHVTSTIARLSGTGRTGRSKQSDFFLSRTHT